jgi:hypothetical protein
VRAAAAIALAVLAISGCGTMLKEDAPPLPDSNDAAYRAPAPTCFGCQNIPVHTDPAGATCSSGALTIKTPGNLQLSRGDSHTIVCRHPGYETFFAFVGSRGNSWTWLDVLMPLGFIVDYADRDAFTLTPKELRLPLYKVE